jgi:hypothetical protein
MAMRLDLRCISIYIDSGECNMIWYKRYKVVHCDQETTTRACMTKT